MLWSFYYFSRYWWLVFITIGQAIHADVCHLNQQITAIESTLLIERFERFEVSNPKNFEEGRAFLLSFIQDVNTKYGTKLTLDHACTLMRENINTLHLTSEFQNILLTTIEALESRHVEHCIAPFKNAILWPYDWFCDVFSGKKHEKTRKQKDISKHNNLPLAFVKEEELPSNCYVGAVEIFAGVLVYLLPFPGSQIAGVGMITDGGRRIVDGVMQLGEERRMDPNYVRPKFGPPFD